MPMSSLSDDTLPKVLFRSVQGDSVALVDKQGRTSMVLGPGAHGLFPNDDVDPETAEELANDTGETWLISQGERFD